MKTAFQAGELTVDDVEGISRIHTSVQSVPISEACVPSDEERTAFERQRLVKLSRARTVRAARLVVRNVKNSLK